MYVPITEPQLGYRMASRLNVDMYSTLLSLTNTFQTN